MKVSYIVALGAVLVLLAFLSPPAKAHEWGSGKWAKQQILLGTDAQQCATSIMKSYQLYFATCDLVDILKRMKSTSNVLMIAMKQHPNDMELGDFIKEDFKNKKQGIIAFKFIDIMSTAMKYIEVKLKLFKLRQGKQPIISAMVPITITMETE